MRELTRGCIAVAAMLFATSSASAFAVSMVARAPTTGLMTSDTVTVDVFLDADGGITFFSVAVINSNPSALLYDGPRSAALPLHPQAPLHGDSTGAQPSYVLYNVREHAEALYPLQTPYFMTFPPEFPGTQQVNINYETVGRFQAATGTGVYVATLVFVVLEDFTSESLSLAFTSSNGIENLLMVFPPSSIGLSAPIALTGVPEPTSAMLIALGIVGVGLAGRRRA